MADAAVEIESGKSMPIGRQIVAETRFQSERNMRLIPLERKKDISPINWAPNVLESKWK